MSDDYYRVLGITRNASQADVQKAYRKLARDYHPDLNPDDKSAKQKFQEVQRAFDVLSDADKRELYDRYGSAFESMGGDPRGGGTWRTAPGGFEEADLGDLLGERFADAGGGGFADLFRQFRSGSAQGGRGQRRTHRGSDLHHELPVPLQTVVLGGQANLTVRRSNGNIEKIAVKIPMGIEDGKKIRLRGQGERVDGAAMPGDILITVRVDVHPYFERRGCDLDVKIPVTLAEAALGAAIDIPAPRGTISLTVPPGSSTGTRLRVRGHGVARPDGTAGDLYAELQIALPPKLKAGDIELIQKLDQGHSFNPRCELTW